MERSTLACSIPGHWTRTIMVVTPRRVAVSRDLLPYARGISQQEAVAREGFEVRREALTGRQRLVLFPLPIGFVLGPEVGTRFGHRGGTIRRDIAFLDERDLRRGSPPERLARVAKQGELALQRLERRVRVHEPRIAQARGPLDAAVGIGRHPDRRARPLLGRHGDAHVSRVKCRPA